MTHHMRQAHDEVAHVWIRLGANVGIFVIVPQVLNVVNKVLVIPQIEVLLAMIGLHEVLYVVEDVHGGVLNVAVYAMETMGHGGPAQLRIRLQILIPMLVPGCGWADSLGLQLVNLPSQHV